MKLGSVLGAVAWFIGLLIYGAMVAAVGIDLLSRIPKIIVPLPLCYAAFVLAIVLGVWLARRAVAWVNGGKDADS